METALHAHRLGLAGVHRDGEKENRLSEHIETSLQEAISPVDLDHPTVIASYLLATTHSLHTYLRH